MREVADKVVFLPDIFPGGRKVFPTSVYPFTENNNLVPDVKRLFTLTGYEYHSIRKRSSEELSRRQKFFGIFFISFAKVTNRMAYIPVGYEKLYRPG
ncbi:MAG TPA: hypothetical protein DEF88_11050 [Porphyromonadaceae bacterium]|nr:hypothetical protein [Porphyromonadaceae bacterium]